MSLLARFLFIAPLASSLFSCGGFELVGNGTSVTQTREIGAFKKLEVSGGVQVTFATGPRTGRVTADENLIDEVETTVRGDTLVVRLKHPVANPHAIKATLSNEVLEGLMLSGTSGFVGPATAVSNFEVGASGGSTAELSDLIATDVSIDASGGSEVTFTRGTTTRLSVSASGGSKVISHGFVAEAGVVEVSGGSSVCVNCSKSITGNASGGSTVTVSRRRPRQRSRAPMP